MAGRPRYRALLATVRANGGWSAVLERIASGETMTSIAKGFGISINFLSHVMRKNTTLRPLLEEAQRVAALYHAERALQVIEEVEPDVVLGQQKLTKAKLLSDQHRWLAMKYDKEFFGEEKNSKVEVNFNLGELHLEAIRRLPARPVQLLPSGSPDVEVIPNAE